MQFVSEIADVSICRKRESIFGSKSLANKMNQND